MSALSLHQLSVVYGNSYALWDTNMQIPEGVLMALVGPNGAGKSTLLKAALGLVPLVSGRVEVFGQSLRRVRKRVAFVPQRESVDWDFPITVEELALMGTYGRVGLFRRPKAEQRKEALHALEMVGMASLAKRQISELSGGQQQRAFLARALAQKADLYLMDEPFAGVDCTSERAIIDILKLLKKENKTAVVVHHDLSTIEAYFDWAALLNIRVIACGPVEEVHTAKNLFATYGRSYTLLDEALRLSSTTPRGE